MTSAMIHNDNEDGEDGDDDDDGDGDDGEDSYDICPVQSQPEQFQKVPNDLTGVQQLIVT